MEKLTPVEYEGNDSTGQGCGKCNHKKAVLEFRSYKIGERGFCRVQNRKVDRFALYY
jgi:hypothetical protein